MTTPLTPPPARTIADLDRPLSELEAAIRATAAANDLARSCRLGWQAEARHWLHDADPDSTVPVIRISLIKERTA